MGLDGDRKYLLEHFIKDEDPTDAKYDWKKGKSVCTLKQSYLKFFSDLKVESVISNRNFVYVVGQKISQKSETWLYIVELNSKTPELFGSVKLEDRNSLCDQQVFSSNVFIICNYGSSARDPVNLIGRSTNTGITVLQIVVFPNESQDKRVTIDKKFTIIPENNGVPSFEQGQAMFFGGNIKQAYVVNNHRKSPSILVVDFESQQDFLYASISDIIRIDPRAMANGSKVGSLNF